MKPENNLEVEKPTQTTEFFPLDGASCYAIFCLYRRNARAVIDQIRAGEWEFHYNTLAKQCLTARRNGRELWVGNGAFFCDLYNAPPAFGLIFRHWVWHAALRKALYKVNLRSVPRMDTPRNSVHNVQEHAPALATPHAETGGDK